MQFKQRFSLEKYVTVFNMRHIKRIERTIWYFADTPLNVPNHLHKNCSNLSSRSPKQSIRTDRGTNIHTFRFLCMIVFVSSIGHNNAADAQFE